MLHWILQNNLYSEAGFQKLVDTLDRFGSSYSIHKVVPFAHKMEPELTQITSVSYQATPDSPWESRPIPKIVVMGSYALTRIAAERGWNPGAWMGKNFDFFTQLSRWGKNMFNRDAYVSPLANVPEQSRLFFIRPNADSKAFTGYVTDWPAFVEWRDKVLALTPEDDPTVTGETLVVIASVKPISREWRTWIVDGKVVTASQYKLGSRKVESADVDARVINFASGMAEIWRTARGPGSKGYGDDLAPAYCLDVFESEGELYIGEVNNLNSAGFYAADMQKLVDAIERMVGR